MYAKNHFLPLNELCVSARQHSLLIMFINSKSNITVYTRRGEKMGKVQEKMIPIGKPTGYLEARRITKGKGGLPSNVLHDNYLTRTSDWEDLIKIYPAWAREVLVYPESGGLFKKGRDVVDSQEDKKGRRWILPASCVPEEATERENVGLFVDPEAITEEKDKVVIHSKSTVILSRFIQESGKGGKVDEKTRIPLEVDPELWETLPDKEKRWLYRLEGVGVRPLVREYLFDRDHWQDVVASLGPDRISYATYTGLEVDTEKKMQIGKAPEHQGILMKGATLEGLRALVEDANAEIEEALQKLGLEKLEATRRLIQELGLQSWVTLKSQESDFEHSHGRFAIPNKAN
jgi:hypothetical protein